MDEKTGRVLGAQRRSPRGLKSFHAATFAAACFLLAKSHAQDRAWASVRPSIHGLTSRERGHVRLRRLGRAQGGRLIWRPRANHWRGIANPAQALQLLRVSAVLLTSENSHESVLELAESMVDGEVLHRPRICA